MYVPIILCSRSEYSTSTTLPVITLLMSILCCLVQCKGERLGREREGEGGASDSEGNIIYVIFFPSIFSRLALPICLFYLYMIQVVTLEYNDDTKGVPLTAFALVSDTYSVALYCVVLTHTACQGGPWCV